jgi:hypothetical protein
MSRFYRLVKALLVLPVVAAMACGCSSDDDEPAVGPLGGKWEVVQPAESSSGVISITFKQNNVATLQWDKKYEGGNVAVNLHQDVAYFMSADTLTIGAGIMDGALTAYTKGTVQLVDETAIYSCYVFSSQDSMPVLPLQTLMLKKL